MSHLSLLGIPDSVGSTGGARRAAQLQPYRAICQAEVENGVSFPVISGYFCRPPDFNVVRDPHPGTLWDTEGKRALQKATATSQESIWPPTLEPSATALPTALTWDRQPRAGQATGPSTPGVSPQLLKDFTPPSHLEQSSLEPPHREQDPTLSTNKAAQNHGGRKVDTGPKNLKTLVQTPG